MQNLLEVAKVPEANKSLSSEENKFLNKRIKNVWHIFVNSDQFLNEKSSIFHIFLWEDPT